MGKRRQQKSSARNRNKGVRRAWNKALAWIARRNVKRFDRVVAEVRFSKVFRSKFNPKMIHEVRRGHESALRDLTRHEPRNPQWGGQYPTQVIPDGFYDQSKEHPNQCRIVTHQSRTSVKGKTPGVSYTIISKPKKVKPKRKAKANRVAKVMAKRSSLIVEKPRKRGAIFG